MKDFYIKYFDAECNEKYENDEGFSSYFLTLDSDVRIEIMANTRLEKHPFKDLESGINHLAYSVGSKEFPIRMATALRLRFERRINGGGNYGNKR